jgi:hypothetical protein
MMHFEREVSKEGCERITVNGRNISRIVKKMQLLERQLYEQKSLNTAKKKKNCVARRRL